MSSPDRFAAQRVRELIACRANVHVADLAVEVRDGTATLHGGVVSEADAREAARLAQSVVGVSRVEPRFHVCPILVAEAQLQRPRASA